MQPQQVYDILQLHVPGAAVSYCWALWTNTPFLLKLTKSRRTKIGDFTSRHYQSKPRITLNHDLNPYMFLITYIHEVAHLVVYKKYGVRVDPHGEEWKNAFQQLMQPLLLKEDVFPDEILHELRRHMIQPKASSSADAQLSQVLRKYDKHADQFIILEGLPEGSIFKFHGRYFKKGKLRRTRIICKELKSKRDYLVPSDALVTDVQLSLL